MSEAVAGSSPKLVRGLGVMDASMIVVGSMIGSGIFITSAESSRLIGSPGWLLVAWALAGEVALATETFERAIGYCNDVGLLSEEIDPRTGELLGNFPQAFSHVGLVNAAWAISQARERARATGG